MDYTEGSVRDLLLAKDKNDPEITAAVVANPALLPPVMEGMTFPRAVPKFKCAKVLIAVSEQAPALLYPHFGFFAEYLDHKNNILKWTAIDILGNMAAVDTENRYDALFGKILGLFQEGNLITSGHVVKSLGTVVKAKPYLEERITLALLSVRTIPLPTDECRRILGGNTIETLGGYFPLVSDRDAVLDFAREHLDCSRNSTRKKAEKFLKRYGTPSS